MKERARELKAERSEAGEADGERDVLAASARSIALEPILGRRSHRSNIWAVRR